jgi:hypothetical protein
LAPFINVHALGRGSRPDARTSRVKAWAPRAARRGGVRRRRHRPGSAGRCGQLACVRSVARREWTRMAVRRGGPTAHGPVGVGRPRRARTAAGGAACEGPIRRTREGGSEWEPIKILLEGDENSNKTNVASNTPLRLTTKVGQAHVATGVPLDLGTNTQPSDPRNAAEKPNLESTDPHRSDR